jgi:hypothetical protein
LSGGGSKIGWEGGQVGRHESQKTCLSNAVSALEAKGRCANYMLGIKTVIPSLIFFGEGIFFVRKAPHAAAQKILTSREYFFIIQLRRGRNEVFINDRKFVVLFYGSDCRRRGCHV